MILARIDVARVQRRTVRLLIGTQVLCGLGMGIGFALAALIVEDLTGAAALAGLGQSATMVGAALLAIPVVSVTNAPTLQLRQVAQACHCPRERCLRPLVFLRHVLISASRRCRASTATLLDDGMFCVIFWRMLGGGCGG